MRPTRPGETHRHISTKFSIDAFDQIVRAARREQCTVATLMRHGVVLALQERGVQIPTSLAHLAAEGTDPDPAHRMMAAAPLDLTFADLARFVSTAALSLKFALADVKELAGRLILWASDVDYQRALDQLLPPRRGDRDPLPGTGSEDGDAISTAGKNDPSPSETTQP